MGLLISGFIFAVFLEIGLRLMPNQWVAYLPQRFDEKIGYVPKATTNGFWVSSCFRVRGIHLNEMGFRGPLPKTEKRGPRIAVFGDSFMEALQVKEQETFSQQLAKRSGAEVLNFGRTGSGASYALAAWRLKAKALKPDIVLFAHLLHNDLMDDAVPQDWTPEQLNRSRAFVRMKKGRAVLVPPVRDSDQDRRNALFSFFLPRFWVYGWGRVQDKFLAAPASSPTQKVWYGRPSYEELGVYRKPKGVWISRWANEVALIRAFAREVRETGAKFAVVMVPGVLEQLPNPRKLVEGMVPGPVPDDWNVDDAQSRMRSRLKRGGVETVNLMPKFRNKPGEVKGNTPKYAFPCDGHWTAEGHSLAAKEVHQWLLKERWLGP